MGGQVSGPRITVGGVAVPAVWYGTAWKEDATEALVHAALRAGFRAIDTANQRKHYHERGVGLGVARAGVPRAQLFLQSKFTFRDGQDHRLPYDEHAPIATQVAQSFERSLEHLGVDHLDSLILHGPSQRDGLGRSDHEAWRAMEALRDAGRVRCLGVSNVSAAQLAAFAAFAKVPPTFVQNRCYADRGWDAAVRAVAGDHGVVYQGFSLLTANRAVVDGPVVAALAARHGVTPAQVVFRFAVQRGMIVLTGTRDPRHMADDLGLDRFRLDDADLARLGG